MYYVQLLRLRKAFTWFAAIVGAIFLIVLAVLHYPHANVDVSGVNGTIPLSVVFLGSSLFAIIFATVCGRSLNQENQRPEMVWTKPISRERLALLYMLCDLAAIAAAFVYALALILITLASVGGLTIIKADAAAPASVCLGLGVAMMWNGELQGLTSWQIGRGGLIVGLSWAVFAWLLPACTALSALWNPAVHAARRRPRSHRRGQRDRAAIVPSARFVDTRRDHVVDRHRRLGRRNLRLEAS